MPKVVLLKGVNVGGHRTFRPSLLAREMAHLGVINVGAAGTFVVRKPITQARLRQEFQRRLSFQTEVMICSTSDIVRLVSEDSLGGVPCGPNIIRFIGILAKRPRVLPVLPFHLPRGANWVVRVLAMRGKFVFGRYRRTMRAIGFLGQLEKHFAVPITIRNWNTFPKLLEMVRS
jgi:uncharacterized protein (DUF1697 family)